MFNFKFNSNNEKETKKEQIKEMGTAVVFGSFIVADYNAMESLAE